MTDLIRQFAFRPEGSKVTHKVRTATYAGSSEWFVLGDLCAVLEIGNPSMAARRLDDDEKGVVTVDTLGGPQAVTIVNESGLWSLVLTSRKPEAKAFKKWLTSEVIPSLRKHGGYIVGQENVSETREQFLARALQMSLSVAAERDAVIAQQALVIQEQAPKVTVLASSNLCRAPLSGGL